MSTPAPIAASRVGDVTVTDRTPVLLRRDFRPDHQPDGLPVFGDERWDLSAAVPDRHSAGQAIRWEIYPEPLRQQAKLYVFALLNVLDDPPRLPGARSHIPAVKTIWSDLVFLRVFLHWLHDRDITALAQVGHRDLDRYLTHIQDRAGASTAWKRRALTAVQRLHAYQPLLPAQARLPTGQLWAGASGAELAGDPGPDAINRTPRIHPDTMQTLLSAALLVTDVVAADLLPACRQLVSLRRMVHDTVGPAPTPDATRRRGADRWEATAGRLPAVLDAFALRGHALPGYRGRDGRLRLDLAGFALATGLERSILAAPRSRRRIEASDLPLTPDLLRSTAISDIAGRAWHGGPVEPDELITLIRHITTAAFLVIAYLSGIRTGEALNLRQGCITRDPKLDLIFLSGNQLKTDASRRERSPATTPWVVAEPVARAVAVLQALSPGEFLFPPGEPGTRTWIEHSNRRSRTPGTVNADIGRFVDWFNTTLAPNVAHEVIPDDEHGALTSPRLRRTLAWHIVRRPGGTVAGATQYGHLHTQMTQGYAGTAEAGFVDDVTFEEFLLRAEQLHADDELRERGEHVSGPAAPTYHARVAAGAGFAGTTITSRAQLQATRTNPGLQIHHGDLVTCVFRPDTALCVTGADQDQGPHWTRCRPQCTNIARTDRDIASIKTHLETLQQDLAGPALPQPLRQRVEEQINYYSEIVHGHTTADPTQKTSSPGSRVEHP